MSKSNKPYRFTVLYSFEDREKGERKEKEVLSDFKKTVLAVSNRDKFSQLDLAIEALEKIAYPDEVDDDVDSYDLIQIARDVLDKIG
jgi:hypothetical protein